MANFVLVHGGGHGGWCYQLVARRLQANGHVVYAPSLPGMGEHTHQLHPGIDLDSHIDDVVNLLFSEDLHDAILVGHSYGGMVITGVAGRIPDKIAHLVFLDAAIPVDGEALEDSSPAVREGIKPEARVVDGIELVLWPDMPVARAIYGVTDEADWAWMLQRLRPHPWKCFEEKLVLADPEGAARIPRTIINCPSTLEMRGRNENLDRYFKGENVWEIETGHDLMITEPEKSAEMLLRLA